MNATDLLDPLADLRLRLHGENAPLNVQYTYAMLRVLPEEISRHPGSRAFRAAQRDYWAGSTIRLDATRRDVDTALRFLHARDLLPRHVAA